MRNRPRRAALRGLVRDYVLEYLEDNPEATVADALPVLKDRLKDDFRDSPFLEFLLKILEFLVPLLIPLLLKKPE